MSDLLTVDLCRLLHGSMQNSSLKIALLLMLLWLSIFPATFERMLQEATTDSDAAWTTAVQH